MLKSLFPISALALLLAATPAPLLACGGSGDSGASDFTGAGGDQAPGNDNGTESATVDGTGDNAQSPAPRSLPEDVQAAAAEIKAEYNVDIQGEWTPQGIDQLSIVLSFYEDKPDYFNNLQFIMMEEVGSIAATGGVGAFFRGNGRGGYIHVYGFSDQMPQYQSPAEVTQHELGHYFSLTNTLGRDWRDRYERAALSGPDVSSYGVASKPAEKMAENWSKLLHIPGEPYFNPPTWNGASAETVAVVKEKIDAGLDPNNGG